jgi:hypothetical protein
MVMTMNVRGTTQECVGAGKANGSGPTPQPSPRGEGEMRKRPVGALAVVLTPEAMMTKEDCGLALALTVKQGEVLRFLAQGKITKEIAAGFTPPLSVKTIETHYAAIKGALGLDAMTQVRVWAAKYFLALAHYGLEREALPKRKLKFQFTERKEN